MPLKPGLGTSRRLTLTHSKIIGLENIDIEALLYDIVYIDVGIKNK